MFSTKKAQHQRPDGQLVTSCFHSGPLLLPPQCVTSTAVNRPQGTRLATARLRVANYCMTQRLLCVSDSLQLCQITQKTQSHIYCQSFCVSCDE